MIDERPIRKAALKAYRRAERQLGQARGKVESFETCDLPAFGRWEAQVFGALMTELRDLMAALEEKSHFLAVIDEERFWTNCSRLVAYRRVMEARKNPTPPAPEPGGNPGHRERNFQSAESENPKVFGERDLPPDFDIDEYDRMSPRQQKEVFDYYEDSALMFELLYNVPAPSFEDLIEDERNRKHGRKAHEPPPAEHDFAPHPPPRAAEASARIKELYRTLVRQLHPDTGGEQGTRERDLWHQVQEAYKTRDLEWLEAITGRVEAFQKKGGGTVSIQVLRGITDEILSALHGLRAQLSKHRRHPAWRFHEKTAALARFEEKRRRQLERSIAFQRKALHKIEKILFKLAERASKPQKSRKRVKATARKAPEQDFFGF